MEMSNGEIRRSWETAADKKKQIQILAELNCTSVENIRSILIAEGIDQRRLPRNRQHSEARSFAQTVGESLSKGIEAGLQEPDSTAEKVAKATAAAEAAKLGAALARAGRSAEAATDALATIMPVLNKSNRPKVEPRRVHILRRMNELFQAIYATELDNDVPDGDWADEFSDLWQEYYNEYAGPDQ